MGQPRVTGTPPAALSGQKYGLATPSPTWYRVTSSSPTKNSTASFDLVARTMAGSAAAGIVRADAARTERVRIMAGLGKVVGVSYRRGDGPVKQAACR